jgi:hypothetical protein
MDRGHLAPNMLIYNSADTFNNNQLIDNTTNIFLSPPIIFSLTWVN